MEFVYFLGRFHVLALHLPIGLVLAAILLDFLARRPRFQALGSASVFLWSGAAATAVGTAILGYLHYLEGSFGGGTAITHMVLGTSVAIASTIAWVIRIRKLALPRMVENGLGAILLVLIVLTGHYGGNLTHGSDYLLEYAPNPVRAMAGLPPRRPRVTVLADADVFLDVIHPMLRAHCTGCHNDERRRGGLSLLSYQGLSRGGETGRVVLPGRSERSEMYRRISLPIDDEAAMPAEGNTPLTAEQIDVIGWWIDAGAPDGGLVGDLDHAAVQPQLRTVLGLEDTG